VVALLCGAQTQPAMAHLASIDRVQMDKTRAEDAEISRFFEIVNHFGPFLGN
jgi:hypothetical protein